MNRTLSYVLCALCLPAVARGAAPLRDKEAVTFEEVERGAYFGVTAGPLLLVNPPSIAGPRPLSFGQMAEVEVGLDILELASVGVFVLASANRAGSEYVGKSNPVGAASGDFSALAVGAAARVNTVGLQDGNGVRRAWLYLRAGAGYLMFSPAQLLPDPDYLVFGGVGVEYYTRLRHFSVGLEVTPSFLLSSGTMGVSLAPNLRYAF